VPVARLTDGPAGGPAAAASRAGPAGMGLPSPPVAAAGPRAAREAAGARATPGRYIPPGTLAVPALLPLLPPMLGHGCFPLPPGADGRADDDGLA